MKKFTAFSFVATKLMLLACFGLMNMEMVEAKVPIPCHVEMASQDETKEDCNACVLSEEVWSSQFVQEKLEFILQNILVDKFDIENFFTQPKLVEYSDILGRSPPDKLGVLHSHLISQRVTLLLI